MKLKKKKRITGFLLVCMTLVLIGLFQWSDWEIEKKIKKSGEMVYDKGSWAVLQSADINAKGMSLVIDEVPVSAHLFMDKKMQLMIAVKDVSNAFQAAVHVYDEKEVRVQKKDIVLMFKKDETCYYRNEKKIEDGRYLREKAGEYYVPLYVIAENFSCTYAWDANSNVLNLKDNWKGLVTPKKYNLQEHKRATIIKNQGSLGTCWAVAALSALETTLKPEENMVFATDHMSIRNSFNIRQNDGGEYTMSLAYLLGWQGPVLAEDDPYGDEISPADLSPVKHVQEVQIYKEKDIEKIKKAVFLYGAVQSSIYTSLRSENSRSSYYNRKEAAYCYTGDNRQNHEIIIIGWDDEYPKENFNREVEGDGAFICQNSWGTGFGQDGIFYVSYYDTHIGSQSVVYTKVEDVDNYDTIYQTDLCGWTGQLGYNCDTAYFANAFTADSYESVKAVGFYATDKETSYEVYFVPDFKNKNSLENRIMVGSGNLKEAGFYTITFDNEQLVQKDQKFAIVVKIKTPDSVHPVAVEYVADETTKNVDLSDGEGYISMYGTEWNSVEDKQNCNVCMKIYTNEMQEENK